MNFSGIYPITNDRLLDRPDAQDVLREIAAAGIPLLQFRPGRDRRNARDKARRQLPKLLQICRRQGVALIINDDIELCASSGADGVHLGKTDCDIASARARLGAGAIIGASCYDSLARAREAQERGANYVAFGRFFPSASKPEARPAQISTLRSARARLDLPIAAIGGINGGNAQRLLSAGAQLLAVIGAICDAPDPGAATRELVRIHARHAQSG